MQGVLGPVVGGLLAITGGLLVALTTHQRERSRWRRDAQLKAATEVLSALQALVRRMINVAYQHEKQSDDGLVAISRYEESTINWNSAMYAALLVSPPAAAELIPKLDREVDRLLDAAMDRSWSRSDFRRERRALGALAAEYLAMSRKLAGFAAIDLPTVWSWEPVSPAPRTSTPDSNGSG